MVRRFHSEIFTPSACIFLALALLALPLRWLLAWLLAAAIHEAFHLIAVWFCGGNIENFSIRATGARITAIDLTPAKQLLSTLAGPVGAMLLLPFARFIPATAVCILVQSSFNLLPLYQLDGGRAIRCIARMLCSPDIADKISLSLHYGCLMVVTMAIIYASFGLRLGLVPMILLIPMWNFGKIPCKPSRQAVQ